MIGPSYPPARVVARRLEERRAAKQALRESDSSAPNAEQVEELVSTAFWTSLRREEGRLPRISLAFVSPERSMRPLQLSPRVPLEPDVLAQLAPAVERPGIHLAVWPFENRLLVWGLTRSVPDWCFVLEVVAPGLLVVKYRRPDPSTKYANVAVLEGADVKFIEQQPAMISEVPPALGSLFNFYSSAGKDGADNLLVRVATSMRALGRGGTLLVVPREDGRWQDSIVQPLGHSVIPPYPDLSTYLKLEGHPVDPASPTFQVIVDVLTGLTAVDGATIISDRFEPLAFGAKILTSDGANRVDRVLLTEPIEGIRDRYVDPSQLGGTRHLSAAQFANDQQKAVALVASQDGRFTVFAWSQVHKIVHAHRMEALLL